MFEIAARISLLACIGIAVHGSVVFIILVVDFTIMMCITGCVQETTGNVVKDLYLGVFSAFVYAGYVASNFRGFLTINYEDSSKYLKYHWLLKSVQGLVIIPFIVLKLMNEHTYSFSIFSINGMVSFVLQYIPLFYMLKWASNLNNLCPNPS